MPTPRKVSRYCLTMTEDHRFDQWILQSSHDSLSWITLHVGNQSFLGQTCFNINNQHYYEYYRIQVFNWISIPGIVELILYEKASDYTTTSSTYTTTTTTVTTTNTTTLTTATTITTESTATTTTAPLVIKPLSYLTVSGNAKNYQVSWPESNLAEYYELQIRYGEGSYSYLISTNELTYVGSDVPDVSPTIQFRVRYHLSGTQTSSWTESNVLTLPVVTVDFKVSYLGTESNSFLRVNRTGKTVQFTDLSTSDHGNIVSWNWVFYTDRKGLSSYSTNSSVQNPSKIYLSKGLFAVGLTVTDETGRSNTVIKQSLLEIGCELIPDFVAFGSNGVESHDYVNILFGQYVNFLDTSSGLGEVVNRNWEFGTYEYYGGLSQTSTFKQPCRLYDTPGNYCVSLTVTGEYGQTAFIQKPSFVRVSNIGTSTTTTWTSTTSTISTTTITTTIATTTSPADWLRIPLQGGIPLCDSYLTGYEPYRAFDQDENSQWLPAFSTTVTTTSTASTSTESTVSTTFDYFLAGSYPGLLWDKNTDLYDFRENFNSRITSDNVYKVREVDVLPPFFPLHVGMIVYERERDEFFVGLESGWSQINPEYVLHVLTHTNEIDPLIKIGEQPPSVQYPGVIWIVPDVTTTSTTTMSTTTATTAWIGNEALIGSGHYPQCSSFNVGHDCPYAFDGNILTYWESGSIVSEQSPEWLGFYWADLKTIKWYKLYCSSQGFPTTWSLMASKNGLTWIEIDYRYLEDTSDWNWYAIDNDTSYSFYRLYIYKTSDSKVPRVYSLEMYQSIVTTTTSTATTTATTTVP